MNFTKIKDYLLKKHIGITLYISGIVFNFIESLYFGKGSLVGFNFKPQSIPELICDDISLIIMSIGFYLMGLKFVKEYKSK